MTFIGTPTMYIGTIYVVYGECMVFRFKHMYFESVLQLSVAYKHFVKGKVHGLLYVILVSTITKSQCIERNDQVSFEY